MTDSFRNPVLPGCHPDPSVCRVGDDYYLATSTFEYLPGIPVHHSRDLVHWTLVGHAVPDHPGLRDVTSSQGLFAPTIRHIGGRFVVVTTLMPDGRSFLTTADDPQGPWSPPVDIEDGPSMDPSLFEDADGTVYYTRHGGGRHGGVVQATIDLATGRLDAPPREIWRGTGGIWPEGPHLYRVDDWYVLLISEGGTASDHSLTVARSRSPWGPFEAYPGNPLLTHRDRPAHPIQAVGHADLVDTPDGAWFAVLLGVRPLADGRTHLGRETFLAPVEWVDGWPRFPGSLETRTAATHLPPRQPAPPAGPVDFTTLDELGPEWVRLRRPDVGHRLDHDGLHLPGTGHSTDDLRPTALLVRQPLPVATVEARLAFEPLDDADAAGLVVRLDERHHVDLVIARADGRRVVRLDVVSGGERRTTATAELAPGPVELTIAASRSSYACRARAGGVTHTLGTVPADVVAITEAEHFTGAFVGLAVTSPGGSVAVVERFSCVEGSPAPGAD